MSSLFWSSIHVLDVLAVSLFACKSVHFFLMLIFFRYIEPGDDAIQLFRVIVQYASFAVPAGVFTTEIIYKKTVSVATIYLFGRSLVLQVCASICYIFFNWGALRRHVLQFYPPPQYIAPVKTAGTQTETARLSQSTPSQIFEWSPGPSSILTNNKSAKRGREDDIAVVSNITPVLTNRDHGSMSKAIPQQLAVQDIPASEHCRGSSSSVAAIHVQGTNNSIAQRSSSSSPPSSSRHLNHLGRERVKRNLHSIVAKSAIFPIKIRRRGFTTIARITKAKKQSQSNMESALQVRNGNEIHASELGAADAIVYPFDHALDENTTNADVNRALAPIYQSFLHTPGSNWSITVDGFSGSGKSHTTIDQQDSIIPYIAETIFAHKALHPETQVAFAAVEIYQEGSGRAQSRSPSLNDSGKVTGVTELHSRIGAAPMLAKQYLVESEASLMTLIKTFVDSRVRQKTAFNDMSSRSHVVCTFTVQKEGCQASNLFVGDLAGGEKKEDVDLSNIRNLKSQRTAQEIAEQGTGINTSRTSIFRQMQEYQSGNNMRSRSSPYLAALDPSFQISSDSHRVTSACILISHVSLYAPYKQQCMHTLITGSDLTKTGDCALVALEHEDDEEQQAC